MTTERLTNPTETGTTGVSPTTHKIALQVLDRLKNNFRKSFSGMTATDITSMIRIWETGLGRVDEQYIWQTLDFYTYEYTDPFAPTIGQFLAKANEFRVAYERKHPVIRNAWEVKDES